MSKVSKQAASTKTKNSSKSAVNFEPTKVSLAVAFVAATSLVLLTIVAVTNVN